MASKKPAWLSTLESKDAKGQTVVSQSDNYKPSGSSGGSSKKAAGLGVDIRNNPGLSVFDNTTTPTSYGGTSGGGTTNYTQGNYTPGNYTIGSDYGKLQALNMGIGTTWNNPNDGSTWFKENDGTITVTHNGTKSANAYTPTDLGILGQQQMAAGLPWYVVQATYNQRLNKIKENPELADYSDDANMNSMRDYINRQRYASYQPEDFSYDQAKPTYEDQYDPQIDALLNEILNREDFSYNAANDPLYQQYAAMYQREGDRAMRDTMAEAAASAGGMNSYAITAAQQANNYYNAQLNDRIPELYQLAYEMYLADKESDVQNLGILQNMSDSQYQRYLNTMDMWQNDRNFAYGMYQDDVANGQWQQQFDYNAMIGERDYNSYLNEYNNNQAWKEKEWNRDEENTAYEREQNEENEAKAEIEWLIGMGVSLESIGAELIAKAGLSEAAVKEMIAKRDSENFSKASGGSTGGSRKSSGSGSGGYYGDDTSIVDNPTQSSINPGKDTVSMGNLGVNDQNYLNVQQALSANGLFGLTTGNISEKDIPRVISIVSDMLPGDEAKRILNKMGVSDLQIDNAMQGPWK